MMKIIETNITFSKNNEPIDCQSRVIEIESWEKYLEEIKKQKQVNRKSTIGGLEGVSFPKGAIIKSLKSDNRTLICEATLWNGTPVLKTAYVI